MSEATKTEKTTEVKSVLSPTDMARRLCEAHWQLHAEGKTEFDGLASWVLNRALRQRFPDLNTQGVKDACQPLIDDGTAFTIKVRGGVLYKQNKDGKGSAQDQQVNDLLSKAGL